MFDSMSPEEKEKPSVKLEYVAFVDSTNSACIPQLPLSLLSHQPLTVGEGRYVIVPEYDVYVEEQEKRWKEHMKAKLDAQTDEEKAARKKTSTPRFSTSANSGKNMAAVMDSRNMIYWMEPDDLNRALYVAHE